MKTLLSTFSKRRFLVVGLFVVLTLAILYSLYSLKINPSKFLDQELNTAEVGKITIENNYNDSDLNFDRNHFAVTEINQESSAINPANTQQSIVIQSGIPSETNGKFYIKDELVSASTFSLAENGIIINIHLKEDLSEDRIIYELSRNYYWSILALNEYMRRNGTYVPNYENAREKVVDLAIKSADNNVYPFTTKQ